MVLNEVSALNFKLKTKYNMKDVCFNCGASEGLHHYETRQCPLNGIEETRYDKLEGRYYKQKWQDTIFEDSEKRKVEDAAPQLLEACKYVLEQIKLGRQDSIQENIISTAIKNAGG